MSASLADLPDELLLLILELGSINIIDALALRQASSTSLVVKLTYPHILTPPITDVSKGLLFVIDTFIFQFYRQNVQPLPSTAASTYSLSGDLDHRRTSCPLPKAIPFN